MNCYKFLLIALPLAMILSCSSDDDSEFEQPEKKSYPIMMTATERPLADPDAPKGAPGRAPKVTTSTLDEFKVFFWGEYVKTDTHYGSSFLLKRSEDDFWGGLQNWPEGYYEEGDQGNRDKKLTFYAYNYFDEDEDQDYVPNMSADAGKAVISVVVDANSASQTDLLAGKNIVSYNDHNGVVPMTFDHISSAVQVRLKKTSSLSNYTVNVGKVVLHHILGEGEYAFDEDNENCWSLYGDPADYVITAYSDAVSQGDDDGDIEIEEEYKLLSKEGDYLFLLPQTLKGWDKNGSPKDSYIEIQCKIYNDTEGYKVGQANEYGSVYLPLGAELKMGYINKLNISMGTALRNDKGERIF